MLSSRLPWQLDLFPSQIKTFVSEITGRIRAWKQADSFSEDLPLAIQIGQCLLLVGFNGNPGRKRLMGMGRCTNLDTPVGPAKKSSQNLILKLLGMLTISQFKARLQAREQF